MANETTAKWKGRKEAARILIIEQKNKHKAEHNKAVTNVVYAEGCQPAHNTHPAILLMERAFHYDQIHTAQHHEAMFAIYDQALTKLDTIPDESEDN